MVNNIAYGGFIVSKNVLTGIPIRYSYREESQIRQLNGWNILSAEDDDDYVNNSENFVIVNADTISEIAPQMIEIFDAPYGTDLFWIYEEDVNVGFYDLTDEREVSIEEILSK
ncbi:DUF2185 domain-containing protein [Lysinibacillus sp. NPDC086135]|uniref:DUF2185 domain-containing protein n=1 Tax=Lysinibacillus sp. NPDC086135 TaxID=3364130 RepID=UPI0038049E15